MFTPLPLFRLSRPNPLAACLALALGFSLTSAQSAENSDELAPPARGRLPSVFAAPSQIGTAKSTNSGNPPRHNPSSASTYYVDTCADDNSAHSLRTLVGLAVSGDTIDLTQIPMPCSTITLDDSHTPRHILINQDNLSLVGPGAEKLTIDGNGQSSIFRHLGTGTLSISGVTIADGKYVASAAPRGGCIYSKGDVYLVASTVTRCVVTGYGLDIAMGGAIYAAGYLGLHSSSVTFSSANSTQGGGAHGGGAEVHGNFIAMYSTISDDEAVANDQSSSYGGGVFVQGSYMELIASTVSHNSAIKTGGIAHDYVGVGGVAKIFNSTISGNSAEKFGGISVQAYLKLANSTVAFNRDDSINGAGVYVGQAPLDVESSIIAANAGANGPNDLGGTVATLVSGADNLITSSTIGLPNDTIRTSCPQLEPLLNNGGPTLTHGLGHTSPAIDKGSSPAGLLLDQRGAGRVAGVAADIGAFEWHGEPDERIFVDGFDGLCDQ